MLQERVIEDSSRVVDSWVEIIRFTLCPHIIEAWKEISWLENFLKCIYCPNTKFLCSTYRKEKIIIIMGGLYTHITKNLMVKVHINWLYRIKCCKYIMCVF